MNKVNAPFRSKFYRYKKSKSGQALIEYSLLVALSVSLAVGFLSTFQNIIETGILSFNAVLESELRTGEYQNPSNVGGNWDN